MSLGLLDTQNNLMPAEMQRLELVDIIIVIAGLINMNLFNLSSEFDVLPRTLRYVTLNPHPTNT